MSEFLTREQAASYLGVHYTTLWRWAQARYGPAFIQKGRLIRYQKSDLDEFLRSNIVLPVN